MYSNWNAVEKPLSIFDLFMSQFSFTITVSELKERNYSSHDIHPWFDPHPLLVVAVHCEHCPSSQGPGSLCWWRLGQIEHWVPQPALTEIPALYFSYSPTFSLFTLPLSAEILVAPDVHCKCQLLVGFCSPNTSPSCPRSVSKLLLLYLVPASTSCKWPFHIGAMQYCTTI